MPLTHPADAVTAVNPSSHTGVHVSPCARGATQSLSVPFRGGVETCTHGEGSASWNTCADPLSDPLSSSSVAPITTVLPSIETLMPNSSPAAPSSAVSLATCVQPEARSPGRVAREHVRGPAVGSLVVVQFRPDHHRVAVDRHARAEVVIRSAVVRRQLGNLRPAGGEVAWPCRA